MRIFIALLVILFGASAVQAADVFGSSKDGPALLSDSPETKWGGLYVGAHAGYAIATMTAEDSPIGLSFESPVLVGSVGFDLARGNFVIGAFGEYSYITADEADEVSDWSAGLRAGVVVAPRTLVYASIAYAQLGIDDVDVDGIRAGAGVEFAITSNVFADLKADYTWFDLEEMNSYADAGGLRVLAGIKFKLNSSLLESR